MFEHLGSWHVFLQGVQDTYKHMSIHSLQNREIIQLILMQTFFENGQEAETKVEYGR